MASEKTAHLVAALDWPAEQALLDLPCRQEFEFEALCTALQRCFGKRSSELELHDRLYARRREAGEKLGILAADIEQLARCAFKGTPPELTGQLALDLVIRGLFPSELHHHVFLAHPRSITQTLEKVEEMEAILMEESRARCRGGTRAVQASDLSGTDSKGEPEGEVVHVPPNPRNQRNHGNHQAAVSATVPSPGCDLGQTLRRHHSLPSRRETPAGQLSGGTANPPYSTLQTSYPRVCRVHGTGEKPVYPVPA
ncbi:UNVERIFIED_CONTAM: hypothetical protein FKN15_013322 [Acipenser sinensis]